MSKIEAGKTTLEASAFALRHRGVRRGHDAPADDANQVFTVEWTRSSTTGSSATRAAAPDLMNLLSNAMKYTPEGRPPSFSASTAPPSCHGELQHLRIIVRDDGIGMSKDYLATIFDSFTREESSPH